MISRIAIALGVVALTGGLAVAQTADSAYTRIDENCTQRQLPDEPVFETACRGYGDWNIYVVASDHGASAAYGRDERMVSEPVVPPSRGLFGGFNDVIEWRLHDGEPAATIHRYIHHNPPQMLEVSGGLEAPNTLIVTALFAEGAEPACPVAFVDASALADANVIARQAADRMVPGWDCRREPVTFDAGNPDVGAWLNSAAKR